MGAVDVVAHSESEADDGAEEEPDCELAGGRAGGLVQGVHVE